jgi:hypothetical protein
MGAARGSNLMAAVAAVAAVAAAVLLAAIAAFQVAFAAGLPLGEATQESTTRESFRCHHFSHPA